MKLVKYWDKYGMQGQQNVKNCNNVTIQNVTSFSEAASRSEPNVSLFNLPLLVRKYSELWKMCINFLWSTGNVQKYHTTRRPTC